MTVSWTTLVVHNIEVAQKHYKNFNKNHTKQNLN